MIVDTFCGAGGWAAGLHSLGVAADDTVGVEVWEPAAATHFAAGFPTVHGSVLDDDVLAQVKARGRATGFLASPPCQAFSKSGNEHGTKNIGLLLDHIARCADGWVPPSGLLVGDDVRADLTLQPLRWVEQLDPDWMVFEQVTAVAPMWAAMADVLTGWGWSAWSGVLSAERYGVAQSRQRAVLIARRDGVPAGPPEPTHTAYEPSAADNGRTPTPSLFGDELSPWRSIADALRWETDTPVGPHAYRNDDGVWTMPRPGRPPIVDVRYAAAGNGAAGRVGLSYRTPDVPANTVTGKGTAFFVDPNNDGVGGDDGQNSVGSVWVTHAQYAALQGFPDWWPWQGNQSDRLMQTGNAVPPALAAALVAPLLSSADAKDAGPAAAA